MTALTLLAGRISHVGLLEGVIGPDTNRRLESEIHFSCFESGPARVLVVGLNADPADAPTVTVKGYVLDSACAFTKGLSKPISKQCAISCANAGSPLVILADDGTIYWPIADTAPSSGQNPKLLPYAGDKVTATGKVYQRGGSH